MLTSISPLGERARGNSWWLTLGWLTIGAVVGGSLLGAVLGTLGSLLPDGADRDWRLAALALSGIGAAIWDLTGRQLPVRRQVNEDWLAAFRRWVYGFGYGIQLGIAPMTVMSTALVPVLMLSMFLADDAGAGLLMGALFGGVRALSVTLGRGVRTAQDLRRLHRRLDEMEGRVRLMGAVSAALLAGLSALAVVI